MMKHCGRCGVTKPITEFGWRFKAKGVRQAWCKPCNQEYQRGHYKEHREEYIERSHDHHKRLSRLVSDIKTSTPCTDCGRHFDPVVMDFDHLDPAVKVDSVSALIRMGVSVEKVREEIAKCEVVCANCHRMRTKNRRQQRAVD